MIRLGLCISPQDSAASGLPQKVYHAIDSSKGKNERDVRARRKKKEEVIKGARVLNKIPDYVLPNFDGGDRQGRREFVAIDIPEKSLDMLLKKIVSGITYKEDGRFIEEDYSISWGLIRENDPEADFLYQALEKYAVKTDRGPGIVIERAVPYDDPKSAFFRITIWGRLKYYAFLLPKEDDE
jgi:hypothetical protein